MTWAEPKHDPPALRSGHQDVVDEEGEQEPDRDTKLVQWHQHPSKGINYYSFTIDKIFYSVYIYQLRGWLDRRLSFFI